MCMYESIWMYTYVYMCEYMYIHIYICIYVYIYIYDVHAHIRFYIFIENVLYIRRYIEPTNELSIGECNNKNEVEQCFSHVAAYQVAPILSTMHKYF